ncbi:hypothetical protein SNE40_006079 [Patella caerulea]|uniref:Uncharacterized protein n=1 Tax=Patella caerulea TaxID=87958 RepID=A0AAN8PWZ4_PATCE
MDQDSGDIKIISDKSKVDPDIVSISVDQETGNVYYGSSKGIGFLSYKQNYRKTIIPTNTQTTALYIGIHGKGSSKRVYWSTLVSMYRSEINTTNLIDLRVECLQFSFFDNCMVCTSFNGLYLANLDGKETESLPNIAITSSILRDIDSKCSVQDFVTVYGDMYISCEEPKQLVVNKFAR